MRHQLPDRFFSCTASKTVGSTRVKRQQERETAAAERERERESSFLRITVEDIRGRTRVL